MTSFFVEIDIKRKKMGFKEKNRAEPKAVSVPFWVQLIFNSCIIQQTGTVTTISLSAE